MQVRDRSALHDAALTPENHREWTARFDALWSAPASERDRLEMDTLLVLIERYEQQCQR